MNTTTGVVVEQDQVAGVLGGVARGVQRPYRHPGAGIDVLCVEGRPAGVGDTRPGGEHQVGTGEP